MPQARNRRACTEHVLIRKGSIQSVLSDTSFAIQKRALQVNATEHKRLCLMLKVMEKNGRSQELQRQRAIARLTGTLQQLTAYSQVLRDDFRVEQFDTLQLGYDPREAKSDPNRLKRFVHETKIYHSGFLQNLGREVDKKIQETDPQIKQRQQRTERLEDMRRENQLINLSIDRKQSLNEILARHRERRETRKRAQLHKLPVIARPPNKTAGVTEE